LRNKKVIESIIISTNAVDLKSIIRNNTTNEHLTLSLSDLIYQFQGSNRWMQLYPFSVDQNVLSIYSLDKSRVSKTVFISLILQELSRKRHATVEDTQLYEIQSTPGCFTNLPVSFYLK